MPEYRIDVKVCSDNTQGLSLVRGVRESNGRRGLNLFIDPKEDHFRIKAVATDPELQQLLGDACEDDIPLKATDLWGIVQTVRAAWRTHVVNYPGKEPYLFDRRWDFAGDPAPLNAALPNLALAGSDLFQRIFFPSEGIADPNRYVWLRKIGEALRNHTPERPVWIRVTSDEFYAPWNLLYSHDLNRIDGRDARADGFWGYKYLVEHVPSYGSLANEFRFEPPLRVALHWDETIDAELKVRCNTLLAEHLAAYADGALAVVGRHRSNDFAAALGAVPLLDHVLYFCCHAWAEGEGPQPRLAEAYLQLTDKGKITPQLIERWMGANGSFEHCPIVFLNACQTGQMNSVFYRGFARTFLNRRASTVIGTQTEVPAVFAGTFAREFFAEFFKGAGADHPRRVGDVLWDLRQRYLRDHYNPLGLLYSVYRGADVYVPHALARKLGS